MLLKKHPYNFVTYNNELVYTPSTWSEWTTVSCVKDSSGLELEFGDVTLCSAYLNTNLKNSTKYGILYDVVSRNNVSKSLALVNYLTVASIDFVTYIESLGIKKMIITTQANITTNRFRLYQGGTGDNGLKVKLNNIRVIELPSGSKNEYLFNTYSALVLESLFPFK